MIKRPNNPTAGQAAIAPQLAIGHYWLGLPEAGRSASRGTRIQKGIYGG